MKPEEKRIAIAEACPGFFWVVAGEIHSIGSGDAVDPIADLNAMHEAEKLLTITQSVIYEGILDEVVNEDFRRGESVLVKPTWNATAAQRAEAFLKTLGLWKD